MDFRGLLNIGIGAAASGSAGLALSGGNKENGAQGMVLWGIIKLIRWAKDQWAPKVPDATLYLAGLVIGPLGIVGYLAATGSPVEIVPAIITGLQAFASAIVGQN
ncbi:hypothetical protein HY496_02610, partial [Candidatus Woesearchaeota archaeon]|nr:hypothetical protein [Candidatus Woesearchaeota archaeon]